MNLNKSTSAIQLGKLLRQMNIHNFDIMRKGEIHKSRNDNLIINLDDFGEGSHWVALNKSHKLYFDSYNQPKPEEIPRDYKQHGKIIEGINQEDCGQLCVLWLYYINNSSEKQFYNLFRKLYSP